MTEGWACFSVHALHLPPWHGGILTNTQTTGRPSPILWGMCAARGRPVAEICCMRGLFSAPSRRTIESAPGSFRQPVPDPASTRRKERFSGKPFRLRCPSSGGQDAPLLPPPAPGSETGPAFVSVTVGEA